ncbi:hypothetical protein [Streptomyces laurentii]|uniref:hypothetical protein n=1 Tax=Streptomyces laurentii TaxID=39478 RepID=UPI003694712D
MTPDLKSRLSELRTVVEEAAYRLEAARSGGAAAERPRRIVHLLYRWDGHRAVRDTVLDLSVSIPGAVAPFSYFVKGRADG